MDPKTGPKSSPTPDPIPYILKIGSSAPNPIIYNTKWHSGHPKSAPKSIKNPSKIDSESDQKSDPENDPSWSRLELRFWTPRRPKTGSRGRQDGQDGLKKQPRRRQDGPRRLQDGSRWPKTAQDGLKTAPRRPKTAQDGPNHQKSMKNQ